MKKIPLKKLLGTALFLILSLEATYPVFASKIDMSKLSQAERITVSSMRKAGESDQQILQTLEDLRQQREEQNNNSSGQSQKHQEEIKSLKEAHTASQLKLEAQAKEIERLQEQERLRTMEDQRLRTLTGQDGGKSIPKMDVFSIAEIARLQEEVKALKETLAKLQEKSSRYQEIKKQLGLAQEELDNAKESVRLRSEENKSKNNTNSPTSNNTNSPTKINTSTPIRSNNNTNSPTTNNTNTSTTESTTTASSTSSKSPTTMPPEIKPEISGPSSSGDEPMQQSVGQTRPQRGGPGGGTSSKQGLVNAIDKSLKEEQYTEGSSHTTFNNDPILYNTWHYYGLTLEEIKEHLSCIAISTNSNIGMWNQAIKALLGVASPLVSLSTDTSTALTTKKSVANTMKAIYLQVSNALKDCTKDSYSLEQFNATIGSKRNTAASKTSTSTALSTIDKNVSLAIGLTGQEGKAIKDKLFSAAETLMLNDPDLTNIEMIMQSAHVSKEEAEPYASHSLALIKEILKNLQDGVKATVYNLPPALTRFFDIELKKNPDMEKSKTIEMATIYIQWEILTDIKKSLMTELAIMLNKKKAAIKDANNHTEAANKRGDTKDENKWKMIGKKVNDLVAQDEWFLKALESPELQLNKEIQIEQEKFKQAYGFEPEKFKK